MFLLTVLLLFNFSFIIELFTLFIYDYLLSRATHDYITNIFIKVRNVNPNSSIKFMKIKNKGKLFRRCQPHKKNHLL